jgi:hypothetical protein
MTILAESLAENQGIQYLDMSNNILENEGFQMFALAVARNQSLCHVKVQLMVSPWHSFHVA